MFFKDRTPRCNHESLPSKYGKIPCSAYSDSIRVLWMTSFRCHMSWRKVSLKKAFEFSARGMLTDLTIKYAELIYSNTTLHVSCSLFDKNEDMSLLRSQKCNLTRRPHSWRQAAQNVFGFGGYSWEDQKRRNDLVDFRLKTSCEIDGWFIRQTIEERLQNGPRTTQTIARTKIERESAPALDINSKLSHRDHWSTLIIKQNWDTYAHKRGAYIVELYSLKPTTI